ncbi:ComF family protein [Candidatus Uhrbacteria bacterium]|nr:ComF family protein [Candidatus Uhrbacteria bacterium]
MVEALFPRFCLGCHREGTVWCETCSQTWWPLGTPSGCPFCNRSGTGTTCVDCRPSVFLDGLSVFASYGNPVVREAIGQWKYVGDSAVRPVIREWLLRAAPRMCPPRVSEAVCAPVPLHISKRRARGFDQAGELTDWCAEIFSVPAYDLLVRRSSNVSQAHRTQGQRAVGELDHLFKIRAAIDVLPQRVILCDDVFTSGATMDSAARCLKEAGVSEVWGFVLAKGG